MAVNNPEKIGLVSEHRSNRIEPKPVVIEELTKRFGAHTVLNGVGLCLDPGTVFGLVGLNGAGKTTLIRILLGLMRRDGGRCGLLGFDPLDHPRELFRRMGVVLEHSGFYGNLSLMDNLRFYARAKGISEAALHEYLDKWWEGTDIRHKKGKVKFFSRGQKMQCGLCRAFLGSPDIFLLDEPAVALDVSAYDHFCSMVRDAGKRGAVVIISSHQFDTIEELCDRIGILENGRISMLDMHQQAQLWILESSDDQRCGDIIAEFSAGKPRGDKGIWTFAVESPEKRIPLLVTELVREGFPVLRVLPQGGAVKESVRRYFSKNQDDRGA